MSIDTLFQLSQKQAKIDADSKVAFYKDKYNKNKIFSQLSLF